MSIDVINVKNQTVIELMHKVQSLARQDLYGIKSKYCWDEVLFKYSAVQLIEDDAAENETKLCAGRLLNDSLSQGIVNQYAPTITNTYITVCDKPYRGVIPTTDVMNTVNNLQKQEGWWWAVTGNFTFGGVDYHAGDEIYWNSTGFHFYGGAGSGGTFAGLSVETGALVGLVDKTITHALGREPIIIKAVVDNNQILVNKLDVDPANPTTKVIIQVEESMPLGLTIKMI